MQTIDYGELLNENLDIIKEIGNIGMGHAATAMSQMVSKKVTMTIPEVAVLDANDAGVFVESFGLNAVGVTLGLQGMAKGMILQILSQDFAMSVLNYFFQSKLTSISNLDEMSLSVIQEIGNITSGAYCNSLASLTGLFIDITTPTHCPDFTKAVLKTDENGVNHCQDKILLINNSFFMNAQEVKSNFLFMPDTETIQIILERLKSYYGLG